MLGVAAYETGEIDVPPLEVAYIWPLGARSRTVDDRALTINVRPLVAADEAHPSRSRSARRAGRSSRIKRVVRALKWGGIALGSAIGLLVVGL